MLGCLQSKVESLFQAYEKRCANTFLVIQCFYFLPPVLDALSTVEGLTPN
ncbi:MAG: hypothetical protein RLZZ54_984 [Cyanobacteriota bacterium]|jgi:hypothetical protein